MRAITNKRYWIKNDDGEKIVVWSAWDAILGIPDDLVDKPALDAAIAGISMSSNADISWHTSGFSYLNGIQPIDGRPIAQYQAVKLGNIQYVTLQVYFTNAAGNEDIVMLDPDMPKDPSTPTMIGGWCDGNGSQQFPSRIRADWDNRKLTLEAYDPEKMRNDSWFYFETKWWCKI